MSNFRVRALLLAATALALAQGPAGAGAPEQATFSVLVQNVSTDQTLVLPDGSTTNVPVAPGAYAVLNSDARIFMNGDEAPPALEPLAEDGNAEPLIAALQELPGVRRVGLFIPGQPFAVVAQPGDRLALAAMFVQSNDLFYGPEGSGIALFDSSARPIAGDVTSHFLLWDAGTEQNEQPGDGPNQAPRQPGPNTGADEYGVVRPVDDSFSYPDVASVLQVTITSGK